jgi:uncharacterized repeat protein (TIGR01451 family)/fimbrial isopeptide formation D2 family protein
VRHQDLFPNSLRFLTFGLKNPAIFLLLFLTVVALVTPAPMQAQSDFKLYLGSPHQLSPHLTGKSVARAAIAGGQASPLALASGDFDEDGVQDLVAGYGAGNRGALVVHRGNLDAFAPQSKASFEAISRGEFPEPFLPNAKTMDASDRPNFIAVGDFNGDSHLDIAFASRSTAAIYVLYGNGKGAFSAAQVVPVWGNVTALTSDQGTGRFPSLFVGANGAVSIFKGSDKGLSLQASVAVQGRVTSIAVADLFREGGHDAALVAGGKLFLLRGQDLEQRRAISLRGVDISGAATVTAGRFIFDRDPREQLAVLTNSGDVHIVAHESLDQTPWTVDDVKQRKQLVLQRKPIPLPALNPNEGWKIAESHLAVAAPGASIAMKGHISDQGFEDVMVIDQGGSNLHVVAHGHPDFAERPSVPQNAVRGRMTLGNGPAVAALAMRVNIDGRPGVVTLNQGASEPSVMMPLPDPTFTVNRTDDPTPISPIANACAGVANDCSLREAILKANATAGTDTVSVPAGTYTLSLARVANDCTGNHGALSVNDSLNIVGAGQATTIIQAGTTNANGVDMVMNVNEDLGTANCPITNATASLSNLTLKFGHNNGNDTSTFDGDGGCMEFDTGSSGTANLSLDHVTLTDCSTTDGLGGGLASFNFTNPGTGLPTITNSIIQNNSTKRAVATGAAGAGGGIWVTDPSRMSMSNSQVINNLATQVNTFAHGEGAGLFIFSNSSGSRQTVIHNCTISGNQAAGSGGGIWDSANLVIDQGTSISNNTAGSDGSSNNMGGGGIFFNASSPDTMTLSKILMTGNSATGNGGAIAVGNNSGSAGFTMSFSRLAGNSSSLTLASANIYNVDTTVTATNNWWGTDAPSSTITNVHNAPGPAAATTFDPFIVLTHSGTPAKIRINQSATLTGDMSKDNHGTAIGLANLDEIFGLPITFDNPFLGAIPQAQPETLNASAQATATFNAGGTSGRGSANATVDQAVVPVNSNLIASATEAGTTATITTVGVHNFGINETVVVSGVGVGGYNGTFTILATPTPTTFTYTTTAGLAASSGGSARVGIIILEPPQITKSFGAATIAVNGTTTVNFSINNPNVVAINGSFTDTLPVGLQVGATPGVTNTCGGTVTAVAGSGTISFSNNLTPVGICTIAVNITGTVDNNYSNSVQILSTDAGNGNTSSANLTVINPPAIAKAFGAATIPLNGTTSLTFTLSSTNANLTLNGVGFTDNLPAGLVVATPNNLATTCGGTATAVAGSSSVSLSGASLAPAASCTLSVDIQGTTAGVKNNSVIATSTNGGTGNTANASITVVGPPTISKAFGAASIPLNGSTSLTFTVSNPNTTVALTGVAFSDTLPAGLVVSTPNGLTGTCGAGTITATTGTGTISLSGGTIAASGSCTFSVNVTGTTAGAKSNTTGAVTSTEGGTGTTSNTAVVDVEAPPSIAKVFLPSTIALNATTSLQFTITNPAANADPLTGVAFTDTLPTGLTVANATATVCGGTLTTTAPTGISLSGATIAANSQCQFSVTVTGAASGQYTNTTGAVTSTNGGTGNTASANLTVASPPSIVKAFGAASIPLNGTTSLTFTVTNPNATVALSGIAFTDNLPAGLVVASTPNLSNTCGGTATAVGGSGSVSLSSGTLASSASCTVSVNVQGTTAGVKNNSVQVTSTEGGTGNTSNASVTVVAPPVIIKAFGAASIPLNGSTSLTFTIQNNNTTVALSGVAFTDTLPAGLVVSTPNGLTGTCGAGTITATAGTNTISLSGGMIAASSSCTFSINVTGTAAGSQTNTTGAVTSTEGGTGGTATASINVEAPPSIAKVFNPNSIALNATTSLTFTITNPAANVGPLTGVAFTDTLPTGLTVANATATVCGGTLTTTAPTGIALSGATIAANSQCQFSVTVTGAASGQYTNTTGSVTSTNGGTGNTATANLTVASPPSITKLFGAASIPLNGTTSLSFTIDNPNTNVTLNGIAFTDNLPAGLVVATPPNISGSNCGGTVTATAGASSVSLSGGSQAPSASCSFSIDVQGTTAGVKNNSTQVTSTEGGTGNTTNASITVVGAPVIIKAFGAASIPLNGSTSLSFTIQNNNTGTPLTGVGFSDTLPAGLVVSTPNGLTGTCGGGTITATQGTGVVSLSGASIASSSSCTFSINVTGIVAGLQNNTTGQVTSIEGGTGGTASASLNVAAPPSIAKVFNPSNIALNATTSLTFTITNPAANASSLTGVAFTDTLPTGLTVANASATVCGGTLTTTAPTGIALSGATVAANSQCQFSVTVTGAASGQYTNTTGNVTSTNGGTGNTASANLSVATPISITKLFGAASIPLNGTTSLTFSIQNPDTTISQTGIAFTDSLPAGLVVAATPNLSNTCGGTATAVAGAGSISLSAATLAASASCTVSVDVQGTTGGVKNNSVTVSSTEGGVGNTSSASITVIGPPVIIKAFGAASISVNASTSLTFTVQNNNTGASLTGVGFSDTFPAGLVVATPNNLTGSCGGGTITATAGSGTVTLAGASLAASSSCTFAVDVTGTTVGVKNNTTGNVTSTEGGTGGTASASITVLAPDLTILKSHSGNFIQGVVGTYTITVSNAGNGATSGTVTVSDPMPSGLTAPSVSGTGWTCPGNLFPCTRSDALAAGASYPDLTLTVTAAGNAPATVTNTATVSGGGEINTANDSSSDVTTITPAITITAQTTTATVEQGGTANYNLTVVVQSGVTTPVNITCTDPAALSICQMMPTSVATGTSPVAMEVITTSKNGEAFLLPPAMFGKQAALFGMTLFGPFLVFVGAAGRRKGKKFGKLLGLLMIVLAVVALSSCGGHHAHGKGTPPGTYTIGVTASNGTSSASTSVQLVVTK